MVIGRLLLSHSYHKDIIMMKYLSKKKRNNSQCTMREKEEKRIERKSDVRRFPTQVDDIEVQRWKNKRGISLSLSTQFPPTDSFQSHPKKGCREKGLKLSIFMLPIHSANQIIQFHWESLQYDPLLDSIISSLGLMQNSLSPTPPVPRQKVHSVGRPRYPIVIGAFATAISGYSLKAG